MISIANYLTILGVVEELVIQRTPEMITSYAVRKVNFDADLYLDSSEQPVAILIQDRKNQRSYKMSTGVDNTWLNNQPGWADATELETDEDLLEKFNAIVQGRDYDTRVSIPIDLPEDYLMALMLEAHRQDITFNQLVVNIIVKQANQVLDEKSA